MIDFITSRTKPIEKTNNEIFNKLDSISRLIKEVSCKITEQNKDLNLQNKLKRIYDELKIYNSIKDLGVKNKAKTNLKSLCADNFNGIGHIYNLLKYFLDFKHLKDYMKSCTDYRINEVKNLVYNVKNLAFLFSFAVISCEEIFEQKSEFNLIKFGEEIDDLIQEILYEEMNNYYRSQDEKSAEKLNELHFPLHFYKIWLKNIKDMRYVICHMRCDEESNKWKCSISSSDAIDNNNINYYMKLKLCYAFQTNWYDARYKKSCFLFNETFGA
jgi:hypothetical protein